MATKMIEPEPTRALFQRHPDTDALIRFLRTVKVGELVSYAAMSAAAHRNIQRYRDVSRSARMTLWSEGIFLLTVTGEGVRRVADADAASAEGLTARKRIRGQARRSVHRLAKVDYRALTDAQRLAWNLNSTLLAMHAAIERPKTEKKIEELCSGKKAQAELKDAASALKEVFG